MSEQENQGGAATSDKEVLSDADALFSKLKGWCKRDYDSHAQVNWRKEAHEDYGFDAGDQLTQEDKNILQDMNRPVVIFNRLGISVDSVAGQEVANRQEVQFLPRKQGDVKVNELLTSAAKWFRQQCDAEDEESDAFRDTVVCGMGWTETRIDYEDNPQGDPKIDRVDPLEMVWDCGAKKRNLVDGRRLFHIRRDVPIDEARALCPGDPDRPFEDADYNATWIDDGAEEGKKPHENDNRFYNKEGTNPDGDDEGMVTLVRAQWWERVPVWLVLDPADPAGEKILTLDKDQFAEFGAKYKLAGAPVPKSVKSTRKVFRQAWLGNELLEIGDAPCKNHFSFKCITGKRDRNKNTFFGIVRAMKDPARWANKWLSQTMHIMNSTAKGGVAVERGQFFDDDAEGESSWAKQDQVTYLKPGALGANPKMMPKPVGQFPEGSFNLMQFAVQSLGGVSGVNVETLGMAPDSGQAASLDRQRKQAVMIILQPLFDGLRRYRKEQGRLMLYLIEHFLSDGRLVKIEGSENAQFVPLIRAEAFDGTGSYDVIVDESPTSPNQKENVWAILQQLLPVIGKMLPPATWLALLKYSPLPTSAQKDISDSITQSQQQQQNQPNPETEKHAADLKASQDKSAADIANHAALTNAKIQGMHAEAAAHREIALHRAQTEGLTASLTAPPVIGPDGQPLPNHGHEGAALIMSVIGEMRRDMKQLTDGFGMLAHAFNAPKQLIRDPKTGDIVGIAPMGANNGGV